MKLNKRLLALSKMVKQPYQVVWDCCCDHGLLGFKILADGIVKRVHFVDIVPDIIAELNIKLTKFSHHLPSDIQWQTFCGDVTHLSLIDNSDLLQKQVQTLPKQLVIISGVGGELMVEMIEKLVSRYQGQNIDYLLCPVQHTYKLRRKLVALDFKLKKEQLIIENKRGYELLLINQTEGGLLSSTGNELWQKESSHEQYLLNLITHYQRITKMNEASDLLNQSALKDYCLLHKEYYANKE